LAAAYETRLSNTTLKRLYVEVSSVTLTVVVTGDVGLFMDVVLISVHPTSFVVCVCPFGNVTPVDTRAVDITGLSGL
jgi:hypothetical protein